MGHLEPAHHTCGHEIAPVQEKCAIDLGIVPGAWTHWIGTFGEVGHGDAGKQVAGGLVLKGNVDLADVVGHSSRTVSTRIVSESTF